MATSFPSILNTNESHNTLISINVAAQTPLKLTSTNYLSWKLQFHTLFIGYDLLGYIDGSKPCPSATPTLNLSSPYENFFTIAPNYSKLKIFGCLCYPWLRPYTTNKLDTRSKPCVFLGYSLTQSAYYCLDPSTSKIYVSRHVRFVESVFPFRHLSTPSCPSSDSIATWIPPPFQIPTLPLVPPLNPSSAVDAQQQSPSEASLPPDLAATSPSPPSCEPSNTNNSQHNITKYKPTRASATTNPHHDY
ncbi:hypothetical protein MRB53_000047 [Persea americana]|uniref:Uncharacterized protein n=1 Tax=Persea americana TaxID=3435 RepID=A0ACC2MNU9_PERAE|nr:hypothetical protein MRB53_000047 [Persea americana]